MMTPFRTFLVVLITGFLMASTAAISYARTPTPTRTPTATPAPTATATPSPQQVALFYGTAWLDGRLASSPIIARIGDVVCGENVPIVTPTDSNVYLYGLRVLSDQYKAGCGREGAVITFWIDNRQAKTTGVWHAGSSEPLTIIVGPPFAQFGGGLCLRRNPLTEFVEPFIGDQLCGYDMALGLLGSSTLHNTIVYSAEQQPGCGFEGAPVTFKLVDEHGKVLAVAEQTGVWHEWGKTSPAQLFGGMEPAQDVNLFCSANGVEVGNVGDGGSRADAAPWASVAVALAALGLAGGVAGLALRRRATMR